MLRASRQGSTRGRQELDKGYGADVSYFEAVAGPAPRSLRAEPATTSIDAIPPGYEAAFPDLYADAYRVAHRILLCRERAADVAQEAMARAYARWRRVSRLDRPGAWVARVAANLAVDLRRRDRTAREAVLDLRPSGGRETTLAERLDLAAALQLLSKRQREVVALRYVADLPETEVAAELGCSIGAVKQHASRGLARLRSLLGEGAVT